MREGRRRDIGRRREDGGRRKGDEGRGKGDKGPGIYKGNAAKDMKGERKQRAENSARMMEEKEGGLEMEWT